MPQQQRNPLSKQIGDRLRRARLDQGLSLSQLASLTGGHLAKSRISNYEQGLRRLGLEEARELAAALGTVSPAYLLCLDDDSALSNDEAKLLRWYREADRRGQHMIFAIAEAQAAAGVAA